MGAWRTASGTREPNEKVLRFHAPAIVDLFVKVSGALEASPSSFSMPAAGRPAPQEQHRAAPLRSEEGAGGPEGFGGAGRVGESGADKIAGATAFSGNSGQNPLEQTRKIAGSAGMLGKDELAGFGVSEQRDGAFGFR